MSETVGAAYESAWPEADSEERRFRDCTFDRVSFDGTNFSGASFARCRFRSCRFVHAELREAAFAECVMTEPGSPPVGTRFAFASLREARFTRCDLSFAVFDRSGLHAVELEDCNLLGARFVRPDFGHALGRGHVITRATFRRCNLTLALIADVSLPGCDLAGSRLREADLGGADLTDADLRECDLFQALLPNAKLAGADLRGAEVSGLVLTGLATFAGLRVDAAQTGVLLEAMGVRVE